MLLSGLLVLGFLILEFIQDELTTGTDISTAGTRCSSFHCFLFMHFLSLSARYTLRLYCNWRLFRQDNQKIRSVFLFLTYQIGIIKEQEERVTIAEVVGAVKK